MRAEYRFTNLEHLTRWLLTTKWGADVMREVLYSPDGSRFYEEHVAREIAVLPDWAVRPEPSYVVVELHGDGYVQVYGPRHVRARIVQRPVTNIQDRARAASLIDEWIALNMPIPYRDIYFPSSCRASGKYERVSVRQLAQREADREFDMAMLRAIET